MDKKSSRNGITRPSRSKKRRFHGNRYTEKKEDTSFTSESVAKLRKSNDEEVIIENNYGYCVLEFFTVFSAISSLVLCTTCNKEIKFSRTSHRGLGFNIALQCSCDRVQYIPSCPLIDKSFEVNRRMIFAMRLLGVGREGLNIFCGMMDMCQGISIGTYYACIKNIYTAASVVYNLIISKAVSEEKDLISACDSNASSTDFTVSGDGTWKKIGFNSLFGVTTLVAKNSKKVVDTVVKSYFCPGCNVWKNKKKSDISAYNNSYEDHEKLCAINHKGSAGKMEVDAIVEMFSRSVEKNGVKYVKYIGDGDTKTFKGLLDMDPYDGDPLVQRKECVGYVHKRMGAKVSKVEKIIKPIYESLSSEELLTQCLGSETQNNDESLNSLIWTFVPKHTHSGAQIIEIATFLAVCIFNEGFIPILKIMTLMGIKIGSEAHSFAVKRDNARIDRSEIRASKASKEARTTRLEERNTENSFFEVEEDPMYEEGMAD